MLFSMGIIVTVAGIVRTWFIYKSLIAEHDNTWYAFPLWIAAAVEIDLGVVSLPKPKHNSANRVIDLCISTCPPASNLKDTLESVPNLLLRLFAAQEVRCLLRKRVQAFAKHD
jgi:hypothetical protein